MDASSLQLIILPAGIIAILFALYLARDVLSRDTGTQAMQDVAGTIYEGATAFIRRQYTTIVILAVVGAVVIGVVIGIVETAEVADVPKLAGLPIGVLTGHRLPHRRRVLDGVGDHRHARRRQGQRPDGVGGSPQPRRGGPGGDARWRRLRVPRRRPVAPGRVGHLHRLFDLRRRRDRRRGAVPHRRLRLRCVVRRALRPARRRHLHQGRRRRLRPRRQGREGHPRGRPPERGRRRGPRRRQRRRLRRSWRGPLRIDRRREHRRDDPRRGGVRHRGDKPAGPTRRPGSSSRSSSAPSGSWRRSSRSSSSGARKTKTR